MLINFTDINYGGIITNQSDCLHDDRIRILATSNLYVYNNYEFMKCNLTKHSKTFSFEWDGNMEGKTVIDGDNIGFNGIYFVKISDTIYLPSDLHGAFCAFYDMDAPGMSDF
jgi:hypothetical protein